ncbi:SusC/RagA family TonB-linked outer membrane protein [Parachryseolinea silvisoli]|uniref:SusC/RagA family TonB-linked outer membrane protein n=1 Tax=Parachryseolinea silvisoli TaxID=2873601 RepID=UPI002265AAFA|nr:SusC/RagA family TonB-linked outer membrane protein [Parachryseolinea silvisoli]MCD9015196.1 SusC/RagA family TonB-linked outer membrane protein [Parachryseolinea silvisoli]
MKQSLLPASLKIREWFYSLFIRQNFFFLKTPFLVCIATATGSSLFAFNSDERNTVEITTALSVNNTDKPTIDTTDKLSISGKVTDSHSGEPLPAVNVIVKGSQTGVTTDANGVYSLTVDNDNEILIFSFIGFKTYEIAVNGRIRIDVSLESDVRELKEVVINAGYYDVTEKEKTGSIVRISEKTISRQPIANPLLALQGQVSGLYVEQANGIPGSNVSLQIRGKNSLQNGTTPLIVIDGVPFTSETMSDIRSSSSFYATVGASPLNNINPADILSIEILKDADATAIYGSRGANGVILITTKKGKPGNTKIDINFNSGISNVAHYEDLLNTQQYLAVRRKAFKNDELTIEPYNFDVNGQWDTTRNTNWQKKFIGGNAKMTNLQVAASGGTEMTQYNVSGSFQRQTTVFPGENTTGRGAIHLSVNNRSKDSKLNMHFTTDYINSRSDYVGSDFTATAMTLAPNAPRLYNEDGTLNWENSTWENPLSALEAGFDSRVTNFLANGIVSYDILNGLKIKVSGGLNQLQNTDKRTLPSTIYDPAYMVTSAESQVILTSSENKSWIVEPQAIYDRQIFSGRDKIQLLLGGSFQSQDKTSQTTTYTGYPSNNLLGDFNSAASVEVSAYNPSEYRYAAIFGRVNYNYKEKYILNLTGRRDGSSRFGPGKQFTNFGAAGFAWIFSSENFMKWNFMSFGKIRSSFGVTGNDQIGDYKFLNTYSSLGGSAYQDISALIPTRLFNPDYAWETTNKFEIALETGFLNDRIFLIASYYSNRSSNQLVDYKVPITTGFHSIIRNFPAKIENSGFEFDLNTVNVNKKIRWTTSFNISFTRNKLIEFTNLESSSYANIYVVGKSLSLIKRFAYQGIDATTGIYQFEDKNSDGDITAADMEKAVEIYPKYYGGLNNSISYKGFNLDIFLQFVKKNASSHLSSFFAPGNPANQPSDILGAWTPENPTATTQRYTVINSDANNAYNNFLSSDQTIVDASFVRIKNVSISYTLSPKWINGIGCRVYIQGQNLITFTKYKGLDPETATSSILPPLRTIVFGINITL